MFGLFKNSSNKDRDNNDIALAEYLLKEIEIIYEELECHSHCFCEDFCIQLSKQDENLIIVIFGERYSCDEGEFCAAMEQYPYSRNSQGDYYQILPIKYNDSWRKWHNVLELVSKSIKNYHPKWTVLVMDRHLSISNN